MFSSSTSSRYSKRNLLSVSFGRSYSARGSIVDEPPAGRFLDLNVDHEAAGIVD